MTHYFEDFAEGVVLDFGSVEVTEAEIIEFARRYDPQLFHVDPQAAKESPYGGLIASGWHTCALAMRLMCDGLLLDSSSQGSPGIDELRWLAPVRPGDVLRARFTVLGAKRSETKPRGTVTFRTEMINQDGVVALSMVGRGLYGTRPG